MKQTFFILAVTALASPHAVKADILAGPITNPSNGNQYILLTQNTWTASQAEAVALGGNLVTINDQAEQDWVFDVFARAGGSGRGLWIGLSRSSAGAPFQWASGESVSYTHWAPREPNFGDERFVYMLATLNSTPLAGFWNNDYDRTTAAYTDLNYSIPQFALHGVVERPCLPVSILTPPASQTVRCGTPVELIAEVTGTVSGYTWTRNGVPIIDGGGFTGATTSTLRLSAIRPGDTGSYRVRVRAECSADVVSGPVLVGLECPADLNADDFVDDTDFVLFSQAYSAFESLGGDFNTDGFTDDADFVVFAQAYADFTCE